MHIVLASSSPRRRELLVQLGIDPTIIAADIDETPRTDEAARTYVQRLAVEKRDAIAAPAEALVIAADTTVAIDGALLGKPADDHEVRSHLRLLSGREHDVFTGLAIRHGERIAAGVTGTQVRFAALPEAQIEWYLSTGEPFGKAGSYAIQGAGGALVTSIEGPFDNVIGLPRRFLIDLAATIDVDLLAIAAH
ncbi:MAG: Maf family protein [Acidimicrobiales bacterium]